MTMARYSGVVQDQAGNIITNAKIEVRIEQPGQPLAALKSDRAGSVAISNPFDAEPDGTFFFHVKGGAYQVRAYVGPTGAPTFESIRRYVPVGLGAETDGFEGLGASDITYNNTTSGLDAENVQDAIDKLTERVPDIAASIHGAAAKAAPVDADEFALVDSAASNILKKLTWANLKAAIASALVAMGAIRDKLTANRTYYVDVTNGNDANNGRAAGAGNAFKTIQKAIDVVAALDISIYTVTIQLADGTYPAGCVVTGPWIGSGDVVISGNAATPANVVVSTTSSVAFYVRTGARLSVQNMELRTGSGQDALLSESRSRLSFSNIRFGATGRAHIFANGGDVWAYGNYAIVGGAQWHLWIRSGSNVVLDFRAVTLTGTPAFSNNFAYVTGAATLLVT